MHEGIAKTGIRKLPEVEVCDDEGVGEDQDLHERLLVFREESLEKDNCGEGQENCKANFNLFLSRAHVRNIIHFF